MSLQSFDDVGARMLADALAEARRAKVALQVQQGAKLVQALGEALKKGRDAGEGAWLLALELLQWSNDRAAFEDRAVDFAVTFELSPPSWEPPAAPAAGPGERDGDPMPAAMARPSIPTSRNGRACFRARSRPSSASSPTARMAGRWRWST